MKQTKLIRIASKKTVYSIWEYHIIFDAFVKTIKSTIELGETVKLKFFGKFEVISAEDSCVGETISKSIEKVKLRRKVEFTRAEVFKINK